MSGQKSKSSTNGNSQKSPKNPQRPKKPKTQKKKVQLVVAGANNSNNPSQSVQPQTLTLGSAFTKPKLPPGTLFAPTLYNYAEMLMNPASCMQRAPTPFGNPTAMTRSITEFQISCHFSNPGLPDDGRFSMLVNPFLGGSVTPSNYKVAIVDTSAGWPADFSAGASYHTSIAGLDPRFDPYFGTLTQPSSAFYHGDGGGWAGADISPFGPTSTSSTFSYGLTPVISSDGAATSSIRLPPGEYTITYDATIGAAGQLNFNVGGTNVITTTLRQSAVTTAAVTTVLSRTFLAVFSSPTSQLDLVNPNALAPASSDFSITPSFSPQIGYSSDSGIVQQYRPIAMSALFTPSASLLNASGIVASAWVPGNSIDKYFTNSVNNQTGLLQTYESVAKIPGAYSGKFVDGTYLFWTPEDIDDLQFYSPSDSLSNGYPALVIAGQYMTPPAVLPGNVPIGKLEIITIYEFETLSLLFELQKISGQTQDLEQALMFLAKLQHCMPNDAHVSWFQKARNRLSSGLRKALDFYAQNKGWINPALTSVGSLLI